MVSVLKLYTPDTYFWLQTTCCIQHKSPAGHYLMRSACLENACRGVLESEQYGNTWNTERSKDYHKLQDINPYNTGIFPGCIVIHMLYGKRNAPLAAFGLRTCLTLYS